MTSVVHGLEAEYKGQVKFVYLNIEDRGTEEIKRTLGFRSQPQFFLLDGDGMVLDQWIGFVEVETFHTAFKHVSSKEK